MRDSKSKLKPSNQHDMSEQAPDLIKEFTTKRLSMQKLIQGQAEGIATTQQQLHLLTRQHQQVVAHLQDLVARRKSAELSLKEFESQNERYIVAQEAIDNFDRFMQQAAILQQKRDMAIAAIFSPAPSSSLVPSSSLPLSSLSSHVVIRLPPPLQAPPFRQAPPFQPASEQAAPQPPSPPVQVIDDDILKQDPALRGPFLPKPSVYKKLENKRPHLEL